MSERAQISWDPRLKAFVIREPGRDRALSAAAPITATANNFQASPTATAYFAMNPSGPRGSFLNPIPHASEPVAVAATSASASQAPMQSSMWIQANTAPLGSFQNPFPHVALRPLENTAIGPPPVPTPVPAPTFIAQARPLPLRNGSWMPSAAEVDALFDHHTSNHSALNGTAPHAAPTLLSPYTGATFDRSPASTPPHNDQPSSDQMLVPIRSQPGARHAPNLRRQSPPRANIARRVHFEEEGARTQANRDAAAEAAIRARQNEAEVFEFTDSNAASQLGPGYRGSATPALRDRHSRPPSAPGSRVNGALQPESRNSSMSSFLDPNPAFEEPVYERWPMCSVCQDRPAKIEKSKVRFCTACFGEACAAEEHMKRASRRR